MPAMLPECVIRKPVSALILPWKTAPLVTIKALARPAILARRVFAQAAKKSSALPWMLAM